MLSRDVVSHASPAPGGPLIESGVCVLPFGPRLKYSQHLLEKQTVFLRVDSTSNDSLLVAYRMILLPVLQVRQPLLAHGIMI